MDDDNEQQHILTTGQIESTLALITDLDHRIDLIAEDDPNGEKRADDLLEMINHLLDKLGNSVEVKAERVLYVLRAAEASRDRLKAAEARIRARRQSDERTVARLRDLLERLLVAYRQQQSDDGAALRTDAGTVYTQTRSRLVSPSDAAQWPAEWLRHPAPVPNKRAAEKALKNADLDAFPAGFGWSLTQTTVIK